MPKLTKRTVEAIKPVDRDILLRDTDTTGFMCKITPKGKRVYLLYYRTREGRERRPAIGEHGKITCDQARDIAKEWLADVHNGGDPSLRRKEDRKMPTLAEFSDKYMTDYAPLKKPLSRREDERLWRLHINPVLGKYTLATITKADVLRLHHSMKGHPVNANRALALLKKAFSLALEWGDLKSGINPARDVKKYREQSRERFLSNEELARLGDILRQCEAENVIMPSVILAIRLLMLTGCRRNEILTLRWNWIDFEHGKIDFPDSKTGKKSVYLSPPALELLNQAKRIPGNPYVITGKGGDGHLVNIEKPWRRILLRAKVFQLIDMVADAGQWKRERIEKAQQEAVSDLRQAFTDYQEQAKKLKLNTESLRLDKVRLHDLRHSFASVGAAGGLSLYMIGKLLGHKESSTTERYSHLIGDPMREAANIIGSRIAAAMSGKQAEILEMSKQRG